jgi:hypothetical protein
MAQRRTKREQQREIKDWRKSGRTAADYAASRGYSMSTLLRWSAAHRTEVEPVEPHFVRLQVESAGAPTGELVVEIGAARVRVAHGFDPGLLRAVVAALRPSEAT